MKYFIGLLLSLLASSVIYSQPLALDYGATYGVIDSYTFPKNTLSYSSIGTDNIKIFIQGLGNAWGTRPYTDFTYNGGSFPNRDSLGKWLNANMFYDTSSGGGSVGTLQAVTDLGNSTSNVTYFTGVDNLDINREGVAIANGFGIFQIDTTVPSRVRNLVSFNQQSTDIKYKTISGWHIWDPAESPNPGDQSAPIQAVDGGLGLVRVSGAPATDVNDFVTLGQLDQIQIGGIDTFIADAVKTVFDITTNAGFIPSWFTLSTTNPITQNQLNRTITFPDNNTMRITFNVAPLIGENVYYVWSVHK